MLAGIVVWMVVGGALRFVVGLEEIGPWIGMFVGVAVWQYIDKNRKNDSKEEM